MPERRAFLRLALGAAAWPLATAGCSRGNGLGLAAIRWGREACSQCGMAISDVRYAVRLVPAGGSRQWNFDDPGCAVHWLREQRHEAATLARFEVASLASTPADVRWLDARQAQYRAGVNTPMGYGYGATGADEAGGVGYAAMEAAVLALRGGMA